MNILPRSDILKIKCLNDGFVSYKQAAFCFTRHSLMDWSEDYLWIVIMFLSAIWTLILTARITAEDPLVSKRCDAKFLQICSDEEKKLTYILDGLRVSKCSAHFNFWVNYSFKKTSKRND